MSLLLDALKKAALEKQRRENPSASSALHVEPVVNARVADVNEQNHSAVAAKSQPVTEIAEIIPNNPIDLGSLHPNLVEPVYEDNALDHRKELRNKQEHTSIPDAELEFDINEIDESYFVPPPEAPRETITVTDKAEVAKKVVENHFTESQSAEKKSDNNRSEDNQFTEPLVATDPPAPKAVEKNPAEIAATSSSPTPSQETKDPSHVNRFDAVSGKAALAHMMARSRTASRQSRLRLMTLYGLLTLTGAVVLLLYYYVLFNDSSAITVPARPAGLAQRTSLAAPLAGADENTDDQTTLAVSSGAVASTVSTNSKISASVSSVKAVAATVKSPAPQTIKAAAPSPTKKTKAPAPLADDVGDDASLPTQNLKRELKVVDNADALVSRGYRAYQSGDMRSAEEAYNAALAQNPYHRDALLGAAAVAVRDGRLQDALNLYQRQLARAPKDEFAQAGIVSISARGEYNPQLESELSRLLLEYPNAAHLYFLKGSLLADRRDWGGAQSAYFEAWQRDNKNADIAYNLAISLDHLTQPKEAARYYHLALQLASHQPTFSVDVVQRRLQELEGTTP